MSFTKPCTTHPVLLKPKQGSLLFMCSATEIFFFCYFGRVLLELLTIKTTARAWRQETSRNYERQRYATNKKGVPIKSDEGSKMTKGAVGFV